MHFITIIFAFLPILTYSQSHIVGTVVEAKTKTPLAYANISILHTRLGAYTDLNGKFAIDVNPNDTLIFTSIGFKKRYLPAIDIDNNSIIVLDEDVLNLNPITIASSKRTSFKKFGFIHSKKDVRHGTITPGYQVISFISNDSHEVGVIQSLIVKVVSSGSARIRIRLYSRNSFGRPTTDLLTENVIVELGSHHGNLVVDLSNYNLLFPKNGLFAGVELMGNVDQKGQLRPANGEEINCKIFMSKNDEENLTWFTFRENTFERYPWKALNNTNSNLMIGIKVKF